MQRRDFLKFMGVSAGATVAANALATIPEAEKQIILLDKPKDIIIANEMPDVDFIISDGIKSISYINDKNILVHEDIVTQSIIPTLGYKSIEIDVSYYAVSDQFNLFVNQSNQVTFTFNLKMDDPKFHYLMELNGRKFMLYNYRIEANYKDITEVQLSAMEVSL